MMMVIAIISFVFSGAEPILCTKAVSAESGPNIADAHTMLLLHFDEKDGILRDSSGKGDNKISVGGNPTPVPGKFGNGLSFDGIDDYLAVVSPFIYEEFAVPYSEKISKEFGGVFLHSCGDYTHNAKVLLKTKGLMGVDFHEFPINKLADITGENIVFNCGYYRRYLHDLGRKNEERHRYFKKTYLD